MRSRAPYLLWSLAILALDQWTKWMIEIHLPPHSVEPLIPGFLNLLHVRNTGVAFGIFASGSGSGSPLLIVIGVAALGAILLYFRAVPSEERRILTALGLVIGGAAGNLLDRIFSGAVTDFVDVYYKSHHWPAFNVADSAICIGIGLLLLDSLPMMRRGHASEGAEAADDSDSGAADPPTGTVPTGTVPTGTVPTGTVPTGTASTGIPSAEAPPPADGRENAP